MIKNTFVLTIVVVGMAMATASAQTAYTFNVTSGNWDDNENWLPTIGPPGADDTAIIPIGRTCKVEDADQAVAELNVQGTLVIAGRRLTLGVPTSGSESTLDGTINLKKVGANDAYLKINRTVEFEGTGEIASSKADNADFEGIIERGSGAPGIVPTLRLEPGVTIRGSLRILTDLTLNSNATATAKAIVDDGDDTMILGEDDAIVRIARGTGQFEVSAGKLAIETFFFWHPIIPTATPDWLISGGEIETVIVQTKGRFFANLHSIDMTGGTLNIKDTFVMTGDCRFTGGTLKVKSGNVVFFRAP